MEHEKSIIPYIVTRCIQEVELRGKSLFFARCRGSLSKYPKEWTWKESTASLVLPLWSK